MLEKKYRLPSFCFKKIYQKGAIKKGKFVTLKFIRTYKSLPRFGIVVSIKTIKKATKRNLARRRASEIIKSMLPKIKPGFDFVLILKKEVGFKEFEEDLKKLFYV